MKEHQKDIRDKKLLSHVASHVLLNNHELDFDNARVLHSCNNLGNRRVLESYYTYNSSNTFNRALDINPKFAQIISNNRP